MSVLTFRYEVIADYDGCGSAEYRPRHLPTAREERVQEQGSVCSWCPLGWSFSAQFWNATSRDVTLNSHRWCNTCHFGQLQIK